MGAESYAYSTAILHSPQDYRVDLAVNRASRDKGTWAGRRSIIVSSNGKRGSDDTLGILWYSTRMRAISETTGTAAKHRPDACSVALLQWEHSLYAYSILQHTVYAGSTFQPPRATI